MCQCRRRERLWSEYLLFSSSSGAVLNGEQCQRSSSSQCVLTNAVPQCFCWNSASVSASCFDCAWKNKIILGSKKFILYFFIDVNLMFISFFFIYLSLLTLAPLLWLLWVKQAFYCACKLDTLGFQDQQKVCSLLLDHGGGRTAEDHCISAFSDVKGHYLGSSRADGQTRLSGTSSQFGHSSAQWQIEHNANAEGPIHQCLSPLCSRLWKVDNGDASVDSTAQGWQLRAGSWMRDRGRRGPTLNRCEI